MQYKFRVCDLYQCNIRIRIQFYFIFVCVRSNIKSEFMVQYFLVSVISSTCCFFLFPLYIPV